MLLLYQIIPQHALVLSQIDASNQVVPCDCTAALTDGALVRIPHPLESVNAVIPVCYLSCVNRRHASRG